MDNINKKSTVCRVLVAPLDWGLGHATRCFPIINLLIRHHIEVILAADGKAAKILQKSYPGLVILRLKGSRVRYSRSRRLFPLMMLLQIPRIIFGIRYERKWLEKKIPILGLDAVISDNRYGLSNKKIPAVFITHQLAIQTGSKWLNQLVQRINYHFIDKFCECWVPDAKGNPNLAGNLSHPMVLPKIPLKYLGILSRFSKSAMEKKYDLLVLLSGPEPQRSIFENILIKQLNEMPGKNVLIRGLPESGALTPIIKDQLTIYDHLPPETMNEIILQSKKVVARCGYSTIMDLYILQQKAVLVPTPGQTEQEYLAEFLMKNKLFLICNQQHFSLKEAMESLQGFSFPADTDINALDEEVIIEWIRQIKTKAIAQQ